MFYQKKAGQLERADEIRRWDPAAETAGCLSLEEFEENFDALGFPGECLAVCRLPDSRFHSSLEVYDSYSYGIVHLLDVRHVRNPRKRAALFFRRNLFLVVNLDREPGVSQAAFSRLAETIGKRFSIERMVGGVLMHLMQGSTEVLASCEEQILDLEKKIMKEILSPEINQKIFQMKRGLTIRKDYYEELTALGESLCEDENDLFEDENFRYLQVMINKAQRLSSHTQSLCESLVHVRESYQSALDYGLNRSMKLLTVVATVFMPLTLIAGWYGMNFKSMPEFGWKYGYLAIIIVSILVVLICLWIFKKKKLF